MLIHKQYDRIINTVFRGHFHATGYRDVHARRFLVWHEINPLELNSRPFHCPGQGTSPAADFQWPTTSRSRHRMGSGHMAPSTATSRNHLSAAAVAAASAAAAAKVPGRPSSMAWLHLASTWCTMKYGGSRRTPVSIFCSDTAKQQSSRTGRLQARVYPSIDRTVADVVITAYQTFFRSLAVGAAAAYPLRRLVPRME